MRISLMMLTMIVFFLTACQAEPIPASSTPEPTTAPSPIPLTLPDYTIAFAVRYRNTENRDIYIMRTSGEGLQQLTNEPYEERFPIWSPDSSQIAYLANIDEHWTVMLMNADGSEPRAIAANEIEPSHAPSWSPDGSMIAFKGEDQLFIINADGSDPRNLTPDIEKIYYYEWSPNGEKIVFLASNNLALVTLASGEIQMLSDDDLFRTIPHWSPDGNLILYAAGSPETKQIYVTDLEQWETRNLSNSYSNDIGPIWSPDGQQIAFTSNRYRNRLELFVMNAQGERDRRITDFHAINPDLDLFYPDWSPDSQWITTTSNRDDNERYQMYFIALEDETEIILDPLDGLGHSMLSWSPNH